MENYDPLISLNNKFLILIGSYRKIDNLIGPVKNSVLFGLRILCLTRSGDSMLYGFVPNTIKRSMSLQYALKNSVRIHYQGFFEQPICTISSWEN